MKNHHPIVLFLTKLLMAKVRVLLSLRYKVTVKGGELLKTAHPAIILPNHPALIDPVILISQIYRYKTATPIVTSDFYDLPVLKTLFTAWGAVRVSNLETGSRDVKVLDDIKESVFKGLSMNKNILLYPSGQLAGQGYEKIFNKKSAHLIISDMPVGASVIGVRITGLWGSMWSKAWMGKTPPFVAQFIKGVVYLFANLLFFMPRRKVLIEFEDLTPLAIQHAKADRHEFNTFLESFFNHNGEEDVNYIKHLFFAPKSKRQLPETIHGSANEESSTLPSNDDDIPFEVFQKIKTIIANMLSIDAATIQLNSNIRLDLGADSLNMVEMFSEIENNFSTFAASQINDIKTVGDLCLVALGLFSSDSSLKPSYLSQPKSAIKSISISADHNILYHFINTFTTNNKEYFTYDAMLGSTTRKTFLLKACVVSEIIKHKVSGKYVGIMLPALQSTSMLIVASYMAGKIPVMLNWTVGKKVLEHCIETAHVEVILSAGAFVSKIDDQLPESIKSKLLLLENEIPKLTLATKLKGLFKSLLPKLLIPYKQIDDTAVVLFTSGSEAMPKAVPLSHRNILSDLNGVFTLIDVADDAIFLGILPPFHSFGFTVLTILPLISGVKVAYSPNPTDAREVVKILKHTKASILVGTPSFLKLLMNSGSEFYFKSVRLVITGAEAMPLSLKTQFEQMNSNALLLEGYGITECAPALTLNPLERQKMNSVGKFLPNIEGLIIDIDTGKPALTGQSGMIYVRGNNVFSGYLNEPNNNPFEEFNNLKYYKTGDLGYIDEDGYLFITGRLKRFIKIAGEMISLPFIEKTLLEKYPGDEKQVIAIEGSDTVNPPQIVLFTSIDISIDEANQYLLANGVAPIAKIKQIIKLDEIPVLGTGKTDYKILRKMIETTV